MAGADPRQRLPPRSPAKTPCTQTRKKTHLDDLVPTSRDNDGDNRVGREADARDPFRVAVLDNVELALAESVPQLDGAVARGRNNLTVVGGERDPFYQFSNL